MDNDALKELLQTPEPAGLGPVSRPGVQSEPVLKKELENALAGSALPAQKKELIRALILLWHDHLDAAHTIAQDIDNPDGAFVHGIMHRREPDYGNAKYWFRRVGDHPVFVEIASRVMASNSAQSDQPLIRKIIPKGAWDAFAFIDAVEEAAGLVASDERKQVLQEIQRIEIQTLVDYLSSANSQSS